METTVMDHPLLHRLFTRYQMLKSCEDSIIQAYEILESAYRAGGKVLVCGNGGSASDSDHIVGELMKGFYSKRSLSNQTKSDFHTMFGKEGQWLADNLQGALPAISLVSQSGLMTAFCNDVDPCMMFAQQVYGYGRKEDVLIGLSTSGNSKNVIAAVKVAKVLGMKTIGFTGEDGGEMKDLCDAAICVPERRTADIQELHLPIYHTLCLMLEEKWFV
ncbi:D-sedoheptulose-7-phosphate isomerase [Fictibacillus fluitans]|uniref:SIS domain-containing protein n=1 Tax=Fictibacillus fluitans TaxID=3058422 RepID=A0ABT8HTG5_9BACL|nr:SIS domain-containing protein [Fictibacillus sp. NE201]MDN4524077.1 SIS domain-containing protein [Fictibacillus sp. NE201]